MAEAKPKKPALSKTPKVFDVARPEQTAAAPTARPVIVGHTSAIKDPMMSDGAVKNDAPAAASESPHLQQSQPVKKGELKIQPLSAQTAKPEEETESEPEKASTENTFAEETVQAENPDTGEDEQSQESSKAVDLLAGGVDTKKDRIKQEEEKLKKEAEIAELVSSKKYFVKIRTPKNKRELRLLAVLVILAIIGGLGWYLGFGPGKELWAETEPVPAAAKVQPAATAPVPAPSPQPSAPALQTYSNQASGISFSYPADWKVETAKDTEFATRDVITLTSPVETIKTAAKGVPSVDAEVFLRTRIFVENTTNPKEYASDLVKMSACSTEDIVVGTETMRLVYLDLAQQAPNISQVSLSPDNCSQAGGTFNANDQIQFPGKKNTYIVYTEYVMSEAYLQKVGTTSKEAIALAQENGIVATKDSFKAGKNFQKFTELIKSVKEL